MMPARRVLPAAARVAAGALALLAGPAAPAIAADAGFTFAGLGLKSDVVTVTARYRLICLRDARPARVAARAGPGDHPGRR